MNRFPLVLVTAVLIGGVAGAEIATPTARSAQVEQLVGGIRDSVQKNNFDRAIDLGESATKKDPASSEICLWLGRAYGMKALSASVFSKLGYAKKCKTNFEKAVALDPNSIDARMELLNYHINAPGIAGGDKEEARRQAEEIFKRDPAAGHMARGGVLEKAEKPAEAEKEYRAAVEAAPKETSYLNSLTSFLVRQKRYKEAATPWEERWKSNPSDMVARYQLARLSLFSGSDLDKAVVHLNAYLAVPPKLDDPTWADAQWRLGLVYEKLGQKENAVKAIEQALKLNPEHSRAKKDLDRIRKA